MPVDLLPVLAVDLLVQQATACGLPEVFHVSPRSRSIARVDLRRWCEQYASDRSEVFQLQANDVTWPGVARCVCMQVNETGHVQRLNTLKQRPLKEVVFSRRS